MGGVHLAAAIQSESTGHELQQRRLLIELHIGVARNIARRLVRNYGWILDPDDIEGCAMVGLCEAASRFDLARKEPFLAFAEQRIRGAVFDEIRRAGTYGRIASARHRRIAAARSEISQAGEEPTDERVAGHLGLSLAEIQAMLPRDSSAPEQDVTALASPCASPETYFECAQFLARLWRACMALLDPEAMVIHLHYYEGESLAQVARTLELTLGRVRHVHARGLALILETLRGDAAIGDVSTLSDSVPYASLCHMEVTAAPQWLKTPCTA